MSSLPVIDSDEEDDDSTPLPLATLTLSAVSRPTRSAHAAHLSLDLHDFSTKLHLEDRTPDQVTNKVSPVQMAASRILCF